jgi:hypothetical protein
MEIRDQNATVKLLSVSGNPRATIYLHPERIGDYYSQRLGPITELARSDKLG